MAVQQHHHARPAATWGHAALTRARRLERRVEYHWPFVAYALLSIATGAYVTFQIITLP